MGITTICLVRHGETDWNACGRLQGKTDIPLNDKGRMQANQCGMYLAKSDWDVIISSPLKRAVETAEIISSYIVQPTILTMVEFIERDYGDAEGMTFTEKRMAYPDKRYPNKEKRELFDNRIMDGLCKIQEAYPNKRVVLVAHGAVIKALLNSLSSGIIESNHTRLQNACLSKIEFQFNSWNIHEYNQTTHLL